MLKRSHSSLVRNFGLPSSSFGLVVPNAISIASRIMRGVQGRHNMLICASVGFLMKFLPPFLRPAPRRAPPLRPLLATLILAA